jgi:hypothetical protein
MENTETKKIAAEYIDELKEISTVGENLIHELGINEFSQLKLKKERSFIESKMAELDQREAKVFEKINLLYGKVSINIEDGTFKEIE